MFWPLHPWHDHASTGWDFDNRSLMAENIWSSRTLVQTVQTRSIRTMHYHCTQCRSKQCNHCTHSKVHHSTNVIHMSWLKIVVMLLSWALQPNQPKPNSSNSTSKHLQSTQTWHLVPLDCWKAWMCGSSCRRLHQLHDKCPTASLT